MVMQSRSRWQQWFWYSPGLGRRTCEGCTEMGRPVCWCRLPGQYCQHQHQHSTAPLLIMLYVMKTIVAFKSLCSGRWKKKGPPSFPRPTPTEESRSVWFVYTFLRCWLLDVWYHNRGDNNGGKVGHRANGSGFVWRPGVTEKKCVGGNLKKNCRRTNWKTCPTHFQQIASAHWRISNDKIEVLWQQEFTRWWIGPDDRQGVVTSEREIGNIENVCHFTVSVSVSYNVSAVCASYNVCAVCICCKISGFSNCQWQYFCCGRCSDWQEQAVWLLTQGKLSELRSADITKWRL